MICVVIGGQSCILFIFIKEEILLKYNYEEAGLGVLQEKQSGKN